MRAYVIVWTHYHMNIILETPYNFFFFFEKPKLPEKPQTMKQKTRVLLKKNPVGWIFFKPGFFPNLDFYWVNFSLHNLKSPLIYYMHAKYYFSCSIRMI